MFEVSCFKLRTVCHFDPEASGEELHVKGFDFAQPDKLEKNLKPET